jgi:hypothetical protein
MLGNYRVYDADAHVILAPAMWEDLPKEYVRGALARRSLTTLQIWVPMSAPG